MTRVEGADFREVGREKAAHLTGEKEIGIGLREDENSSGLFPLRKLELGAMRLLSLVPSEGGKDVVNEAWRWGKVGTGGKHGLNVVVEIADEAFAVERVEPESTAVEEEHADVVERARTETATNGEVDAVAELAALPFVMVEFCRDSGEIALSVPTAATGSADEEVSLFTNDIDGLAIGADNEVTCPLGAVVNWQLGPYLSREGSEHGEDGGHSDSWRIATYSCGTVPASNRLSPRISLRTVWYCNSTGDVASNGIASRTNVPHGALRCVPLGGLPVPDYLG